MPGASTGAATDDRALLEQARGGDEDAFTRLVDPHRRELHAHCYRMLGSVHDAEDALQDALLRAWRAIARFEGRSSLRSWLYTIATNTCLDQIALRPKRVLPIDYGPATDPHVGPGEPLLESVWIEPYPDEILGVEDGFAAPEARYERREAVELAFVAALQHLPGSRRAVLIQREVLGWERDDVDAFVAMLTEDATFTMPPLASWYEGRESIARWATDWPLSGPWRWRVVRTSANGQPTLGFYAWDAEERRHRPFALNVLSFRGELVSDVTAFIARSAEPREREVFERYPDEPVDMAKLGDVFARFGLPTELD